MPRPFVDHAIRGLAVFLLAWALGDTLAASPEERTPPSDTNEHRVLEIRLGQAVLMALANNRTLSVQRLAPDIQRTFEADERALFDPILSGDLFREQSDDGDPSISTNSSDVTTTKRTGGSLGVSELLPTGTKIG
ncbi:MAG: hypothetical protein KKC51_13990, partial [Verrucomicrobia bacterium]|nr:hypothetical protein [Verrucomicrobiota bacterium]